MIQLRITNYDLRIMIYRIPFTIDQIYGCARASLLELEKSYILKKKKKIEAVLQLLQFNLGQRLLIQQYQFSVFTV